MAPGQNVVVKESLPASSVEVPTGCLTSEPPIKEKHFVIDAYESARGEEASPTAIPRYRLARGARTRPVLQSYLSMAALARNLSYKNSYLFLKSFVAAWSKLSQKVV